MTLSEYSHERVQALIDSVARETVCVEQSASSESVHDLRVAIRRLSENLRVFADLFPRGAAKRVREELREAMKLAGKTRNYDIAGSLMRKAEVLPPDDFTTGRGEAAAELMAVLKLWRTGNRTLSWREQLHV